MKNNKTDIDLLLKRALKSEEAPEQVLIDKVKYDLPMEDKNMNKHVYRISFGTVLASALVLVCITTTVFAALHFLSPSEVAELFEYQELAAAFNGEEAILINETKSQNGYDVSFIGIVSGAGLTGLDSDINTSKTYAVMAIAKQNGEMPSTSDDAYGSVPFFISPLIKGQKPWEFNLASMGGGYSSYVVEGIMYRLVQCDDMEIFADRGLSLIVSSTDFYSTEAYDYNETTGLVTPKSSFDGVNMVFDLPLDTSKADYNKAQQYLDSLWDDDDDGDYTEPIDDDGELVEIQWSEAQ